MAYRSSPIEYSIAHHVDSSVFSMVNNVKSEGALCSSQNGDGEDAESTTAMVPLAERLGKL